MGNIKVCGQCASFIIATMSATEPPPVYSATPGPSDEPSSSTAQPPSYTFPTRFEIGGTYTQGILVDIPAIKGHLAMLDAFANLKKEVQEITIPIVDMPYDKEKRWAWFVGLAVERYVQNVNVRPLIIIPNYFPST